MSRKKTQFFKELKKIVREHKAKPLDDLQKEAVYAWNLARLEEDERIEATKMTREETSRWERSLGYDRHGGNGRKFK